jgi:hypothetical protein
MNDKLSKAIQIFFFVAAVASAFAVAYLLTAG